MEPGRATTVTATIEKPAVSGAVCRISVSSAEVRLAEGERVLRSRHTGAIANGAAIALLADATVARVGKR